MGKNIMSLRQIMPLNKLRLSEENPRLNIVDVNQELLELMLQDQGTKLLVLSEDILKYGLNPLDLWAVYPSATPGEFIVAEGNRRLSSLIILDNPELIKDSKTKLYPNFKKLLENSSNKAPKDVECVVFSDAEDEILTHWMEVRHLGLNGGKGTAAWDGTQKLRFIERKQGAVALLEFWKELMERSILTARQINSISKTNWERILNKKGSDYLGLVKYPNNYAIPSGNIEVFTQKVRKIAEKLKDKTVGIVYDNVRIQTLLDEVDFELFGSRKIEENRDVHTQGELTLQPIEVNLADENNGLQPLLNDIGELVKQESSTANESQPTTSKDMFNGCHTIIPVNYGIRSSNMRINKLIKELKELDPAVYPNACGLLLRCLFELSAKHFLETQDKKDHTGDEFDGVLSAASTQLFNLKLISSASKAALKADKDNLRTLFNGYAHDTDTYPSAETLKNYFKSHREFFGSCLKK